MFRCDCYPNHEICKNKNTCEFWIPLNQKLKQLNQQISYELKILESLSTLVNRPREICCNEAENSKEEDFVKIEKAFLELYGQKSKYEG